MWSSLMTIPEVGMIEYNIEYMLSMKIDYHK